MVSEMRMEVGKKITSTEMRRNQRKVRWIHGERLETGGDKPENFPLSNSKKDRRQWCRRWRQRGQDQESGINARRELSGREHSVWQRCSFRRWDRDKNRIHWHHASFRLSADIPASLLLYQPSLRPRFLVLRGQNRLLIPPRDATRLLETLS